MKQKYQDITAYILLAILFIAGVITIFNTTNSYGGGDNISHYFGSHWGWKHPAYLFNHWHKPVFTILSSPFAQFGFNGLRIFNLIMGLSTAFITYKIAQHFKFKTALIAIAFTLLTPVYFIMIFTGLTEVTFSFFLMLSIYLFFTEKLHWSAVVISFIPMIRTEGFVILPLFLLAYGFRRSYWSMPLLLFGFFFISVCGLSFHESFWWLITENPYRGAAAIYGHGTLFHFVDRMEFILGYFIFSLFLVGSLEVLRKYLFSDRLRFEDNFYILLIIIGPFLAYFSAHSVAWWLGKGSSLGLIRVITAISPIASLMAVYVVEIIYSWLSRTGKIVFYVMLPFLFYFLFAQSLHINKGGFYPNYQIKMMTKAADYVKENQLDTNYIMAYDVTFGFALGIDPFDKSKVSWYIKNDQIPSQGYPQGTLIIWDAHLGNNEGHTLKNNLLNDTNLVLLTELRPKNPIKVLGGYDYEIAIFQVKNSIKKP